MLDFKVSPLPGNFGAEVTNIDVSSDKFTDVTFKELLQVLYDNRLVVIRDQMLSKAEYLAFGKRFGTPIPHVLTEVRMPNFPEMLAITNTKKSDDSDKPRNGAAQWHTDQSYDAEPATATMLYSIKAPKYGGETLFCDMMSAYEALPEKTRAQIDDLEVEHLWGRGVAARPEDIAPQKLSRNQANTVPRITHPLVKRHPITGKKTLYSVIGTSRGIIGMSHVKAKKLLNELGNHAFQDCYRTMHKYRENDITIWDTTATMHSASPISEFPQPEDVRLLYRISVRGLPTVFHN